MSASNSNGFTVRSVSATTDTVLATDDIVIYTATSAKAVSLTGAASAQLGKVYRFTNIGAGAVTITPTSGLIDGAATKVIAAGGTAISALGIVNDGTGWRTFAYTVGS